MVKIRSSEFVFNFMLCILIATQLACSDLTVFVSPAVKAMANEQILLNEDGTITVSWDQLHSGSYDVYLLDVKDSSPTYNFSSSALTDSIFKSEKMNLPPRTPISSLGNKLGEADGSSFQLDEAFEIDKTYLISFVDKRTHTLANSFLFQAGFGPFSGGTVEIFKDFIEVDWNSVAGANRYEVYADENGQHLLGSTTTNTFKVDVSRIKGLNKFYVTPFRGKLSSKKKQILALAKSATKVRRVASISPDGFYRAGSRLDFVVELNNGVSFRKDLALPLVMNDKTVIAESLYSQNAGVGVTKETDRLYFSYTVEKGDNSSALASGALLEGELFDDFNLKIAGNLPPATDLSSLSRQSQILIDTIDPLPPKSVGFSDSYTNTGSAVLNWVSGSDLHFDRHAAKLCSDMSCESGCSLETKTSGTSAAFTSLSEGLVYACVRSEDRAGNVSTWINATYPLVVDKTSPTIIKVSAEPISGTFKIGDTVSLKMEFSEKILVSGQAQLRVAVSGTPRYAQLVSGSGSNTLLFHYLVEAGDESLVLNYQDTQSLSLASGSTIQDLAGNLADLTLPQIGSEQSLAGTSAIKIDGVVPVVNRVYASSGDGNFTTGAQVTIAVEFSESVTLTNPENLRLSLNHASTPRYASYASGSGTSTLIFSYLVASGDHAPALDYSGVDALAFHGSGTLKDSAGNYSTLTLPLPGSSASLKGSHTIRIDALAPSIKRVYSNPPSKRYRLGETIPIFIEFSEAVYLTDPTNLRLHLETNGNNGYAIYSGGDSTPTLSFDYTVQAGDESQDLEYLAQNSLSFLGSGSLKDDLNNISNLTLPQPGTSWSLSGQANLTIDTSDFLIENVSSTVADGYYRSGSVIDITVKFNKVVFVDDGANLSLTLATGLVHTKAFYFSGSTTDTLTFRYIVQDGDNSPDLDYLSSSALAFSSSSSGKVTDEHGVVNSLLLPPPGGQDSLGSRSNLIIDTLDPIVTKVYARPSVGNYKAGSVIAIAVEFSEPISASNSEYLGLALQNDASTSPLAIFYEIEPDGKTVIFRYQVAAGDDVAKLDYVQTLPFIHFGGSLADRAGNDANYELPPPGSTNSLSVTSSIKIDTVPPTINRVYSQTVDGSYRAGANLLQSVDFSEAVVVSGSGVTLPLDLGTTRQSSYGSGSGSSTLSFSYTVQAGDNSTNLTTGSSTSLIVDGVSSVRDEAGNVADLGLPTPLSNEALGYSSQVKVDTNSPNIIKVKAKTADGSYTFPQNIDIAITFDENISVTEVNKLHLQLETGSTDRLANYLGKDDDRTIVMRYQIVAGDFTNRLDAKSLNSLYFDPSGSIRDLAGNAGDLALPPAPNNLASQSNLLIDAISPEIPTIDNPLDGSTSTSSISTVSGTTEALATVKIFKNGNYLGSTQADSSGTWSYALAPKLTSDTITLEATASDSLGNESAKAKSIVTVNLPQPSANAGTDVYAGLSANLTGIVSNATTIAWTKVSGPGNITFGSASSEVTTVSASTEGIYILRLTATNEAGVSQSSDMQLTSDTTPPTFSGIRDLWHYSPSQALAGWRAARDNLTSEYDITYEICYGSVGTCSSNFQTMLGPLSGQWDYNLSGLADGQVYEVSVRALDKAGNSSGGSLILKTGGLKSVREVGLGTDFGCANLDDDTVRCWGSNSFGQLGIGSLTPNASQKSVPVPGLSGVKSLASGYQHSCALLSDGTVKCWGNNSYGQLGSNTSTYISVPTSVNGLSGVASLHLGGNYSCAIMKSDRSIQCWGRGVLGELGNGTISNSSSPVLVSGLTNTKKLFTGSSTACAIVENSSRELYCWGNNDNGQLGIGDTTNKSTPQLVTLESEPLDISTGWNSTCVLKIDHTVSCWGNPSQGQLGIANIGSNAQTLPIDVPGLSDIAKIYSGISYNCAIKDNGEMLCWGLNSSAQLGDGSAESRKTPVVSMAAQGKQIMNVGPNSSCGLTIDGRLTCWGKEDYSQLGNGKNIWTPVLNEIPNLSNVRKLALGLAHSCALLENGLVKCWGNNSNGQLGSRNIRSSYREAQEVVGLNTAAALAANRNTTCAILQDTSVKCWGANLNGELANGSTIDSNTPMTIPQPDGTGKLTDVVELALTSRSVCALIQDGKLYCWGSGDGGMLADGQSSSGSTYPKLSTVFGNNIKHVSAGFAYICVILNDSSSTVKCIGSNNNMQLGNNSYSDRTSTPTTATTNAESISSLTDHSCILTKTDRKVKCWGDNERGQIGNGSSSNDIGNATEISGLSNVTEITTGQRHTCALLSNSTVSCWGLNDGYQLANTFLDQSNSSIPVSVTGLKNVLSISSGGYHSCAILTDKTVKCWGYNDMMQSGIFNAHAISLDGSLPVLE